MNRLDAHLKMEKLRALNLEGSQNDSDLIRAELETGWQEVELLRVDTRKAFTQALEEFKPDVVLCDSRLPGLSGRSALGIVRQACPEIPVIMVTGTPAGIEAFNLVKMGARDYVTKSHLHCLAAAVQSALSLEEGIRSRKVTESALREDEVRYQSIMYNANDAIVAVKPEGIVYLWNRKAEEMFGYTAEEAIGRNLPQLVIPEPYRQSAEEGLRHFAQTGECPLAGITSDIAAKRKDGGKFPVELSISCMNINGEWHGIGIIRDITERKRAEELLRLNEERLQLAQEAGAIGTWEWDLTTNIAQCSDSYFGIFGIPHASGSATYEEWLGRIHPEDRSKAVADIERALKNHAAYHSDYRIVRPDGSIRWLESNGRMKNDAAGKPLCMLGAVIDITGRKRLEEQLVTQYQHAQEANARQLKAYLQLEQSQHRLLHANKLMRATDEMARVGGWALDMPSMKLEWSDEVRHIHEVAADFHPTLEQALAFYTPESRPAIQAAVQAAIDHGTSFDLELQLVTASQRRLWVHVQGTVVYENDRPVQLIGAFQDVTERKRAETELAASLERMTALNAELQRYNMELKAMQRQLLQSEKMASIGLLAAGVAHEINNPVGYVSSNLGTLEKYLANIFAALDQYGEIVSSGTHGSPEQPGLEKLQQLNEQLDLDFLRNDIESLLAESRDGLERIKKIVLDLKDFSRSSTDETWQWADLTKCLESTLAIVRNELKYKCEVIREFDTLPRIYCLPSQIEQVFVNLLVNAAQSIETHGTITIRTGQEQGKVWVEIADTGAGIPPDILPHIFDPFFTTKPVGSGTGLGLPVSYGIIERHHGRIEVHSEAGKGSTFHVTLPVQPDIEKENA